MSLNGNFAGEPALDSDSKNLLAEEIDSIDSPMAGDPPAPPVSAVRPSTLFPPSAQNLSVSTRSKPKMADRWVVFDVTFGVPLFDAGIGF